MDAYRLAFAVKENAARPRNWSYKCKRATPGDCGRDYAPSQTTEQHTPAVRPNTSLVDELNFFACFELDRRQEVPLPAGGEETLTVREQDVRRKV